MVSLAVMVKDAQTFTVKMAADHESIAEKLQLLFVIRNI